MKQLLIILVVLPLFCSPVLAGDLKKMSLDDASSLGQQFKPI